MTKHPLFVTVRTAFYSCSKGKKGQNHMGTSEAGRSTRTRTEERDRRARFSTETVESTITNLDDLDVTKTSSIEVASDANRRRTKMQIAKEFEVNMESELGEITKSIDAEVSGLGLVVLNAPKFQGMEKFLNLIGRTDSAQVRRLRRLKSMNLRDKVSLVSKHGNAAVVGMGRLESRQVGDVKEIDASLDTSHAKYKEAQPLYKQWQAKRKELEVDVSNLELELNAGTISEDERPAKEKEFDDLKRELHKARMEEESFLVVIKEAQTNIKSNQIKRDGALKQIEAIHIARRSLLEKLEGLAALFNTAMTDVITKAELERYNLIDPTINRTATLLLESSEKTTGAVLALVAERVNKAYLDPAKSQELMSNLMVHLKEWAAKMDEMAADAERGNRVAPGNGTGAEMTDFQEKQ